MVADLLLPAASEFPSVEPTEQDPEEIQLASHSMMPNSSETSPTPAKVPEPEVPVNHLALAPEAREESEIAPPQKRAA